ncbi:terminase small subunit [Viscerimonas tarda]
MATPPENQFWKSRDNRKKNIIFESPESLLQAAYEYFDWCDKHTWYKQEAVKSGQGMGTIISVPVVRPYSLGGLCIYLGCSQSFFNKFKQSCSSEFAEAIGRIENIIETQQFEGISLGMFNTAITNRKIKDEHEESTVNKGIMLNIEVIDEETKKELKALCKKLKK